MFELSQFVHHLHVVSASGEVTYEVFAERDDVLIGGLLHSVDVDLAEGSVVVGLYVVEGVQVDVVDRLRW